MIIMFQLLMINELISIPSQKEVKTNYYNKGRPTRKEGGNVEISDNITPF